MVTGSLCVKTPAVKTHIFSQAMPIEHEMVEGLPKENTNLTEGYTHTISKLMRGRFKVFERFIILIQMRAGLYHPYLNTW